MERLKLKIDSGSLAGKIIEVGEAGLRLGRSSSNDIHIPDEQLSRNHCLFEVDGSCGIKVTDLASANGTLVNGKVLGNEPYPLREGDLIEVGETVIRVIGEQRPPKRETVDLGLGEKYARPSAAPAHRRSPLANVLWGVAVLAAISAICVVLTVPQEAPAPAPASPIDEVPKVMEVRYEKIEATLDGIFRYEMTVSHDGTLHVTLDDTKENRHPTIQPKELGKTAVAELNDILRFDAVCSLEPEYSGPEPEPQALESWRLRVVYTTRAHDVRVINTQEPEAFRKIREKLEAFSNNELGINAIHYSREKLVAMAEEQIALGKTKWEDRDVQHGNLFGAVSAYREAIFYLDTLDPKPECIQEARRGLDEAKAALDKRYGDQRFAVDRAINMGDWDTAQRELKVLLEMIPDRKDDRNREASAKLIDVEKRMKGGK